MLNCSPVCQKAELTKVTLIESTFIQTLVVQKVDSTIQRITQRIVLMLIHCMDSDSSDR